MWEFRQFEIEATIILKIHIAEFIILNSDMEDRIFLYIIDIITNYFRC